VPGGIRRCRVNRLTACARSETHEALARSLRNHLIMELRRSIRKTQVHARDVPWWMYAIIRHRFLVFFALNCYYESFGPDVRGFLRASFEGPKGREVLISAPMTRPSNAPERSLPRCCCWLRVQCW
jgi:hypothetical protein